MALPSKSDIQKGTFTHYGVPWINVAAKDNIELDTLTYTHYGVPWYGVEEVSAGNILKVINISLTSISKVQNTSKASISKIANTTL
jgi:hypothetical protein